MADGPRFTLSDRYGRHHTDADRSAMRGRPPRTIDEQLRDYEGLIHSTAELLVESGGVAGMDFDDIRADLRIKVWRALEAFDASRTAAGKVPSAERFVFMCVRNRVKDLGARKKHPVDSLDELMSAVQSRVGRGVNHRMEGKYLAESQDDAFRSVEDEPFQMPNTLTGLEQRVVVLVYRDYRHGEVAVMLGITKRDVERAMRSVRLKLADWKPSRDDRAEADAATGVATSTAA